ncbi:papain-like cysteine protease family protein [Thermoleptolyngbya sp. C42_A2020_037]|uniref:C39 family peptidase n=1 Tax=Thermoleptolyngbya sp. C42_A2020_037 TaxID=2747799 RepID=UPI0025EF9E10|nr:papain-like cysteine protease family protein [Thermoleptolyngbya sp. C42_A2020_037]
MQWIHSGSREPRPLHLALDRQVFRANELPIHPPEGYGCRCRTISLTERQLQQRGLTVSELKRGDTAEVEIDGQTYRPVIVPSEGWSADPPGQGGAARREEILQRIIDRSPEPIATQIRAEAERINQRFAEREAGTLRTGAGGSWRVFDERADRAVPKQFNDNACAAACGEMLLADRGISRSQRAIAELVGGVPITDADLGFVLDQLDQSRQWSGGEVRLPDGATTQQLVETLNSTGSWAAILWEPGSSIGHMVIVDGFDPDGRLLIRDPWGRSARARAGSRYKMEVSEFERVWTERAVLGR